MIKEWQQQREWNGTICKLRSAAEDASAPLLLNTARINMLEMLGCIDDLRRQVADLEELLRREEARP